MSYIRTTVQDGETIGLYSAMYGCTDEDIRKANGIKGDKLKAGQQLNIPIGKMKMSLLPTSTENPLKMKLSYFDDKINDIHIKLYTTELKPEEREALEQQYIELKNLRKERQDAASIDIAGNGINLVLEIKKDMTVSEFRRLFPECGKNFYDYACDTDQLQLYEEQHTWYADPDRVWLREGDKFMLKADEYAYQGFWTELALSLKKQFGRLDE